MRNEDWNRDRHEHCRFFQSEIRDPKSTILPMTPTELKERTMQFALRVLEVVDALPRSVKGKAIAGQLSRNGTSVAANYRAACRAKSRADFIHKLAIVEEEANESVFWIELIQRSHLLPAERLQALHDEANEILAIVVSSINTAKSHRD